MTLPPRRGENIWIDSETGFVGAAWYWPSTKAALSTAVLIVPGIVHEERTMNGGLVALAEALADVGVPALLMDLHGCSQSAGRLDDEDIGAHWRADIRAALSHVRETGAKRIIVLGVRLGVPLAVEALSDEPLAALVAWAPIVSGKRYVRELKVLQHQPDFEDSAAGSIAIGGFSIPASVLDYISKLDLNKSDAPKTSRIMLCEAASGLNASWLGRMRERGLRVEEGQSLQIQDWLFSAADQPDLPHGDIRTLAHWCRALHDEQAIGGEPVPAPPAKRSMIEFVHQGVAIRETFVEIGPSGLTGVLSEPVGEAGAHPVRLLLSTVGPGRTFADFARDEASRGNQSLRFDFAGFGTSGRGAGPQGGELYTDEGASDVHSAIEYLRQAGHAEIYGLGFCAGAWSMLQAGFVPELRAVVAINVALYREPGPPVPDLVKQTRKNLTRISPVLARSPLLRSLAAHVRRAVRKRREPVEWLIDLCATDAQVVLAYAEHDLGLDYLKGQMERGVREQLRRPFTLQTYAGLGHLAEGPAARARLFQDIADYFAGLDSMGESARALRPVDQSLGRAAGDLVRATVKPRLPRMARSQNRPPKAVLGNATDLT